MTWDNPPPVWSVSPSGTLTLRPQAGTDFWQRTHYGFQVDNGHFLHTAVTGDMSLTATMRFSPVHRYDQAGLMVRLSTQCWLKTSVEFEPDGESRLGAVVTNQGWSDWSTQAFSPDAFQVTLRIHRRAGDYTIEALVPGDARWSQLRIAHLILDNGGPVAAGLYACSPQGEGFRAEFSGLCLDQR